VARAVVEEQPLLLFVDDAEWLDEESARALAAVLRDLGGSHAALLFAAPRPAARAVLAELRDQVGRDYVGCSLVLAPLDEAHIRRLAAHFLPSYDAEQLDRLTRRVEADSAGLPLLVVELCNAVRLGLELGALDDSWPAPDRTLDQTMPGDLPDAIVAAIRIGFRRLGGDAQETLAAASVLGDRVDAETLERTTGLSAAALLPALDELEWQRWLAAEPRGYAFVARVVRNVVARDMLTPGQRQRIQAAAGLE
jgi:predicted ATPase